MPNAASQPETCACESRNLVDEGPRTWVGLLLEPFAFLFREKP